mmetsp:Transcript_40351/g.101566  ORF Transcript_40351/g.101566 Transcript_40351/m.101566 type:complete len:293 (-) Transcript_40351:22-900(-)
MSAASFVSPTSRSSTRSCVLFGTPTLPAHCPPPGSRRPWAESSHARRFGDCVASKPSMRSMHAFDWSSCDIHPSSTKLSPPSRAATASPSGSTRGTHQTSRVVFALSSPTTNGALESEATETDTKNSSLPSSPRTEPTLLDPKPVTWFGLHPTSMMLFVASLQLDTLLVCSRTQLKRPCDETWAYTANTFALLWIVPANQIRPSTKTPYVRCSSLHGSVPTWVMPAPMWCWHEPQALWLWRCSPAWDRVHNWRDALRIYSSSPWLSWSITFVTAVEGNHSNSEEEENEKRGC